jgi:hypothetical protein
MPLVSPLCSICEKSVRIETAKADEFGHTVHEDCYVASITMPVKFADSELNDSITSLSSLRP